MFWLQDVRDLPVTPFYLGPCFIEENWKERKIVDGREKEREEGGIRGK